MNKQSLFTFVFFIIFGSCMAQSTDAGIIEIKVPLPSEWKNRSDLDVGENLFKFDIEENDIELRQVFTYGMGGCVFVIDEL